MSNDNPRVVEHSINSTIESYDKHGQQLANEYRSLARVSVKKLNAIFRNCQKLLEVGVGSGADFSRLVSCGYEVTGIEPSATLIKESNKHYPVTRDRIHKMALPLPQQQVSQWKSTYDGIHCSAVMMHIPAQSRPLIFEQFAQILKPNGCLHLVISETRNGLNSEKRDNLGRLYEDTYSQDLTELASLSKFTLESEEDLSSFSHSRGSLWKRLVFRSSQ